MIETLWTATKAILGVAVLTGWALYSAQRLDRAHMAGQPQQETHLPDPTTTGSIKPKER